MACKWPQGIKTIYMSNPNQWAAAPIDAAKGFKIHLIVFLLATPAIWLVWYLTDRTYPWPLWSTPAWAIGVLFHYLGVFVFKKSGSSQK
jgi:hypothetical protein